MQVSVVRTIKRSVLLRQRILAYIIGIIHATIPMLIVFLSFILAWP